MMLRVPPSLNDECVSALLAHEDNGHALLHPIDVEEHSVLAEKPQLALGHRIRAKCLHVPSLDQRIHFESSRRLLQHRSTRLPTKSLEVVDHRLFDQ